MNNLKNMFVVVVLFVSTIFYGQRKQNHEKIKSLKVAFITEKLDLSSNEAQVFWPIYNDYQEKREALRQKERTQIKSKIKDAVSLSEKDAENILQKYITIEEEQNELDKLFLNKINKVISAKKTLLLLRSEEAFKRQLIKQYRNKKGNGNGHQ